MKLKIIIFFLFCTIVNAQSLYNKHLYGYKGKIKSVISYDYENMTVTYREPGKYKPENNKYKAPISTGVTIKSGNVSINTGLSNEEILEQLDLDYHDVRDYLGDELR